jgi:hypothetical protein
MTTPAVSAYSTTPANNVQANTGVNWDEGMSPAAVNNSARQNMADLRTAFNDLAWFKYGKGDQDYSPVYVGATQFKITGADVSAVYHVGRRVRAVGSSTGTIYGYISVVAFSTDTTVTIVWDSGSLSNETLTISLSQIPVTGNPNPNPLIGTFTPTDASGASLTFSSAVGLYRKFPGLVHISMKIVFPVTADGSNVKIGSLPFTAANVAFSGFPVSAIPSGGLLPNANGFVLINTTNMSLIKASGLSITNSDMTGNTLYVNGAYPI